MAKRKTTSSSKRKSTAAFKQKSSNKTIMDVIPSDLREPFRDKPQLGKLTFADIDDVNTQLRRFYMRDPKAYLDAIGSPPDMGSVRITETGPRMLPHFGVAKDTKNLSTGETSETPFPNFPSGCSFCWPNSCGFCWPSGCGYCWP